MWRATRCESRQSARTFTPKTRSQPSSGNSSVGAPQITPALLTSTCRRPAVASAQSANASTSSGRARSAVRASARRPSARAAAATSSQAASRREATRRSAPASASPSARWRPSPRPPPVTSAVRPERSKSRGASRSGLAAEREPGAEVAAVARGRADRDVLRDAPQGVDHEAVDEPGDAALVRADLWPARGPASGQARVVDPELGAIRVLARHEVAGPGEEGRRLVVVAPELARGLRVGARRAAEALLEEREGRERVAAEVAHGDEVPRRRRHEIAQPQRQVPRHGLVEPALLGPAERAHGRDPLRVAQRVEPGRNPLRIDGRLRRERAELAARFDRFDRLGHADPPGLPGYRRASGFSAAPAPLDSSGHDSAAFRGNPG